MRCFDEPPCHGSIRSPHPRRAAAPGAADTASAAVRHPRRKRLHIHPPTALGAFAPGNIGERRLAKAHLLKEQLAHLWSYTYEAPALRFLTTLLLALRWQRLPAFQWLGAPLIRHLTGILNYCHEKVPFGKVEAINGNIRAMLRRGRGYRDHA